LPIAAPNGAEVIDFIKLAVGPLQVVIPMLLYSRGHRGQSRQPSFTMKSFARISDRPDCRFPRGHDLGRFGIIMMMLLVPLLQLFPKDNVDTDIVHAVVLTGDRLPSCAAC